MKIQRIVADGQTGADRAALNWAVARGIPHGGWCPKGRRAKDGVIPARYAPRETASARYEVRTRRNVADSDGTLILNLGALDGGTLLTANACRQEGKPCLVVQLDGDTEHELSRTRAWMQEHGIATLNIAGPRETKRPGSYEAARQFLDLVSEGALRNRRRPATGLAPG